MVSKANPNFTSLSIVDQRLLRATIRKDVEFLRSEGLMDYSLLLAIETLEVRPTSSKDVHQHTINRRSVSRETYKAIEIDIDGRK